MNIEKEKLLDKAKKLQALSGSSNVNESIVALRKLNYFLTKNNISEEELNDKKLKDFTFIYKGSEQRIILLNLVASVIEESRGNIESLKVWGVYKSKSKIKYELTQSEFVEVSIKFDFLCKHFKKEKELFLSAFCLKNDICLKRNTNLKIGKNRDYRESIKISQMMDSISRAEINKQIAGV